MANGYDIGMNRIAWRSIIGALPPHLTLLQVSKFFRRSQTMMSHQLKRAGYRITRKTGTRIIPEWARAADWKQPNADLARAFGVSREWVRRCRSLLGKPKCKIESRGRKPKLKNAA